jgi:hypothetical protein
METAMKPLLTDETVYPDEHVLEEALGDVYPVFQDLMTAIQSEEYGLVPAWKYYRDGKAWLCKASHKKKTVFWLSVYDKAFKTSFYFTAKTGDGIAALDIDEKTKIAFQTTPILGKLKPLVLEIDRRSKLKDALRLIEYKKNL